MENVQNMEMITVHVIIPKGPCPLGFWGWGASHIRHSEVMVTFVFVRLHLVFGSLMGVSGSQVCSQIRQNSKCSTQEAQTRKVFSFVNDKSFFRIHKSTVTFCNTKMISNTALPLSLISNQIKLYL